MYVIVHVIIYVRYRTCYYITIWKINLFECKKRESKELLSYYNLFLVSCL